MRNTMGSDAARWLAFAVCFGLLAVWGTASAQTPKELFGAAASGSAKTVDHTAWDSLLKSYVKPGPDGLNRVDYLAFKEGGHGALKDYISTLVAVDPATLNRSEQFALLANLYNAKTIDIVLENYPVKSIKDISLGGGLFAAFTGGPWKAKVLKMKGVALSLDDIEHGILRPTFRDPRVHYAVNCASVGCPNLGTEAFTGDKLVSQLDAAARAYVNHPRGAKFGQGGLVVSSIYSWFDDDFGGNQKGIIEHLKIYAAPDLAQKLKGTKSISDYAYDWSINDAKK